MKKVHMKKGISVLTLSITLLIMTILTTATIYIGNDIVQTAKKNEFAIELLNIQNAVDNYYIENSKYPKNKEVNVTIQTFSEFEKKQFLGETITNNLVKLYRLDLEALGIDKTEFGNNTDEKDVYAVSLTTGKVYYIYGIKYEGKTHYTMNDVLYEGVTSGKLKGNDQTLKKDDIIFKVSSIDMTSDPVNVTVLVPIDATINHINVTDSIEVGDIISKDGYQTVDINTGNVVKNYTISIIYTLNDVEKTVSYNVLNVDNEGPAITITELENTGYVTLTVNATDSLSGVKKIKYETTSITDEEYFNKYGKTLNGTTIDCYENTTYTIYAIDELGNISMLEKVVTID